MLASSAAQAQPPAPSSLVPRDRSVAEPRFLDWRAGVDVGNELAGGYTVERVLGGCGMTERWNGMGGPGDQGMSLFTYDVRKDLEPDLGHRQQRGSWRHQGQALRAHSPSSTTFQGEIEGKTGAVDHDRTILTAMPDGRAPTRRFRFRGMASRGARDRRDRRAARTEEGDIPMRRKRIVWPVALMLAIAPAQAGAAAIGTWGVYHRTRIDRSGRATTSTASRMARGLPVPRRTCSIPSCPIGATSGASPRAPDSHPRRPPQRQVGPQFTVAEEGGSPLSGVSRPGAIERLGHRPLGSLN